MTAASLTSHLARWPDHRLHRLLLLRPDLCHPPVPDFAALAARASTQTSVLRALDGLDRAHLDVLEALAVLARVPEAGQNAHPAAHPGAPPDAGRVTSRSRLAAFLGSADPDDETAHAVESVLADLVEAALVLPADDGWQVPLTVATALGPHPLGLGRNRDVLVPDDGHTGSAEQSPSPAEPSTSAAEPSTSPSSASAIRSTDGTGTVSATRTTGATITTADARPTDRGGILAALGRSTDDPNLLDRASAALEALQSSPVVRLPEPPGPVHDLLLESGLLVRTGRLSDGTPLAEHPLDAGLAWRDGTSGLRVDTAPPAPTGRTVPAALSSNAALAAITDLLRGCDDVLTALADGLPTLRSGGVGVRELRRLADSIGSTPEDTSWLLELLAAAGLVMLDPDTSCWIVAGEAADWRRSGRHVQWEALVLGWLGSGRAPMLGPVPVSGSVPSGAALASAGRTAPVPAGGGRALAADRNRPDAPRLRASVLETALELTEDYPGARLDDAVARRLHWRRPRQSARTAMFTAPLLAEAARLGLTGAGALTAAGALVAGGRLDEAAADVGTALPAPLTRVRLQGDLTAVAPGYLDPEVARKLAAMADAEGDGAARVYRFSDDSLHRALDSGLDTAAIEEFLEAHSEDELPQSLRYLVRDVARRHGALAVGPAGSWLRVQDEALLDAIVADPALSDAGLERVAPTVAVAAVGERELHRMLAAAGHRAARSLPALRDTGERDTGERGSNDRGGGEGPAGATTTASGTGLAGVAPSGPGPAAPTAGTVDSAFPAPVRAVRWTPSEEERSAQIARLRAAPRPAPTGPGTEEAVVLLRHAARQRTEVDLVTVDQRGHRQSLRVVPLAVAGGRVRCLVPAREAETVVPLHRVVSADFAGPSQSVQAQSARSTTLADD